jgi:transposase
MSEPRPFFTAEFKQEAVMLVQHHHKPAKQVAQELGIDPSTLRRWRRVLGGQTEGAVSREASAEVAQLRREVVRLQMERDILKKAVAFFAKESR